MASMLSRKGYKQSHPISMISNDGKWVCHDVYVRIRHGKVVAKRVGFDTSFDRFIHHQDLEVPVETIPYKPTSKYQYSTSTYIYNYLYA
jgi:hypothetical protein